MLGSVWVFVLLRVVWAVDDVLEDRKGAAVMVSGEEVDAEE